MDVRTKVEQYVQVFMSINVAFKLADMKWFWIQ